MTAEEMFEKLSYKKVLFYRLPTNMIRYKKDHSNYSNNLLGEEKIIDFYLDTKTVECYVEGGLINENAHTDFEYLKAINKQVEELRW